MYQVEGGVFWASQHDKLFDFYKHWFDSYSWPAWSFQTFVVYISPCNPQRDTSLLVMNNLDKTFAPSGAKPAQAQYFTGHAWVKMLAPADNAANCTVGDVLFEPGCRNNWHSHPHGQLLVVTTGTGFYQEKGQPARLLRPGDIVVIAPDVVHWHEATATDWFAHYAINPSNSQGAPVWLEPVTDADYQAAQS